MVPRVYTVWSAPGLGKTTLAILGKGPKFYGEFDAGSFDRAAESLEPNDYEPIKRLSYLPPLSRLGDSTHISTESVGTSGKGGTVVVHKLDGWEDLRIKFENELRQFLEQEGPGWVIMDTGTKYWELAQNARQERNQKETNIDSERLNRLEYADPNSNLEFIIGMTKAQGKNFVMLCHEKEKWNSQGVMVVDGPKHAKQNADMEVRLILNNRAETIAIVQKPVQLMQGWEIPEPSLARFDWTLRAAAKWRMMKNLPKPSNFADLQKLMGNIVPEETE